MTSLYRLALRAFPARHRAAYAADMVEAFEGLLATHRQEHGLLGALRFVSCIQTGSRVARRAYS
jgi:hypothetical protein